MPPPSGSVISPSHSFYFPTFRRTNGKQIPTLTVRRSRSLRLPGSCRLHCEALCALLSLVYTCETSGSNRYQPERMLRAISAAASGLRFACAEIP